MQKDVVRKERPFLNRGNVVKLVFIEAWGDFIDKEELLSVGSIRPFTFVEAVDVTATRDP